LRLWCQDWVETKNKKPWGERARKFGSPYLEVGVLVKQVVPEVQVTPKIKNKAKVGSDLFRLLLSEKRSYSGWTPRNAEYLPSKRGKVTCLAPNWVVSTRVARSQQAFTATFTKNHGPQRAFHGP